MKTLVMVVLLVVLIGSSVAGAVSYRVTNLGTLGGQWAEAIALNDNGQVTGNSQDMNGYQQAFIWQSGVMTSVGTFGGHGGCSYGINNSGVVVGYANSTYLNNGMMQQQLPFKYGNGVLTELGNFPAPRIGRAMAINDNGQIVIWGDIDNYNNRSTFLYVNGVMTELAGEYYPYSWAIGNLGQVLGRDIINYNGVITHLTLPANSITNHSADINDNGKIVGDSEPIDSNSFIHAYLWDGPNNPIDIGVLAPQYNTRAYAINNSNQIVGIIGTHAALWGENTIYDLNTLIPTDSPWYLTSAVDINESGQILCNGYWKEGTIQHAFLLTPVPEPTSLLALCGGVVGLLAFRRRRR